MNVIPYKFRLVARNEGQIKSYESCLDVRAWNHHLEVRDGHLRAWIKSDMPCCVIPISTLAVALRIMGCKSRGRVISSCHPNCKSKLVLESICSSCETIKECLKKDPKYEIYFEEEDFETSHWPCNRCLDALKSIKMFWRIILERVFRISIPKTEKVPMNVRSYNMINTARTWQADIVHEALIVKNMMPLLECGDVKSSSVQFNTEDSIVNTSCPFPKKPIVGDGTYDNIKNKNSVIKSESYVVIPNMSDKRKVSRSIAVKIKKKDIGCEAVDLDEDCFEVNKNNLNNLQLNLNQLKDDVERLKKENISLKIELQNVYKSRHLESKILPTYDALAYLPKPFDDEPSSFVNDVESEMVITMKNCQHSGFKQVSVLQVLHKSNNPFYSTQSATNATCRKEDPLRVLQKLQNTFGAMLQREVKVVSDKTASQNPSSVVNASYHKVKVAKSRPKLGGEAKLSSVSECDCSKEVHK